MTGGLAFCYNLAKKERTKDWTQAAEEERKASNRNLKAQQIRESLLFCEHFICFPTLRIWHEDREKACFRDDDDDNDDDAKKS
jgi:hypothetical protein